MTATLRREDAVFTPRSGDSWRDPWPMYAALRDCDPVHRVVPPESPQDDYWVLSRYADVSRAAIDWETFSSGQGLTVQYEEMDKFGQYPPLVMLDPPRHSELRRLVHKGFTPRQMVTIEPMIREFAIERIEKLRAEGGGDIVTELFKPLPSMVVAHYLGLPSDVRDKFDEWTDAIVGSAVGEGAAPEILAATTELFGYFAELVEQRKKNPGEDTVSHLVMANTDGDDVLMQKVLAWAFTMITGGNDTITGMLGGSAILLSQHPDERTKLIEDPGLISGAVEELLRLTSPVQGLARMTTRDVEVEQTTIPAGRKVLLLYGSANRDERQYGPDAAQLDVLRKPSAIMTFAQGQHHCIGNAAARLQSRVVLEELLARCPDFTVDRDAVTYSAGMHVRRPTSVPFTSK